MFFRVYRPGGSTRVFGVDRTIFLAPSRELRSKELYLRSFAGYWIYGSIGF